MRELRVEDALLYLDQVKMEFGDRPHIYNEFLDIMKTFKTQQIDTPGVIRRVSTLFQGNKKLVLGFNTFLPEGYKIELPLDGDGPPVAVYRAPGMDGAVQILGPSIDAVQPTLPGQQQQQRPGGPTPAPPAQQQQQQQIHPSTQQPIRPPGAPPPHGHGPPHQQQHPRQQQGGPLGPPGQTTSGPGAGGMVVDQQGNSGPYQQRLPQVQSQQQAMQLQQAQQRSQQQSQSGQSISGDQPPPGRPAPHHAPGMPGGGQQQQHPPPIGPDGKVGSAGPPRMGPGATQPPAGPPQPPGAGIFPPPSQQPPVEFDHAINYVTTIKKRFAAEPDTYKKFLEILHTYQKEQRGIKEVLDEVSLLFADHPDLLKEFTYFLPDAVQAQAKAQLDAVAKESEARKRAQSSKQAIMQTARGMQRQAQGVPPGRQAPMGVPGQQGAGSVYAPAPAPIPFGATKGRSEEREKDICRTAMYGLVSFAPVRPPRRNEPTPSQAALENGRPQMIPEHPLQPTTAESAFFERAKLHLNRKELAPDKPPAGRRHTPYTEFLKCLHLFGAGILNKEELFLLLRGLFIQGHAPKSGANAGGGASNPAVASDAQELLREFEEIMVGRGPYADQETMLKDKSKYGSMSSRDFDSSNVERSTPSYRNYPSEYPHNLFFSHSGQTEADAEVLNSKLICVAPESRSSKHRQFFSPEDYDGVRARRNAYEEIMFRVEDERFEVDMAIERNVMAMRQVEPIAEEISQLRENEEKDGQPIGRMQYKLRSRTLNCAQLNAIARLYGDSGDEVLQHLLRNPMDVLPIVNLRLKEKDAEWRKAKTELSKRWKALCEANYEGSLDVLCHFHKKDIEKYFARENLVEECIQAAEYADDSEKQQGDKKAIDPLLPKFSQSCPDEDILFFQPHLRVPMSNSISHKDAFNCVSSLVVNGSATTDADRERVGRIWSEFMVPLFNFPVHWVLNEVRESARLDKTSSVVRYAPGQDVRTAFGDGRIVSLVEGNAVAGLRYKIRLPYGDAYVRPGAVIHSLDAGSNTAYARSQGSMRAVDVTEMSDPGDQKRLGKNQKLMFATESIYVFMRLYAMLVTILSDTREKIEQGDRSVNGRRPPSLNPTGMEVDGEATSNKCSSPVEVKYDYSGIIASLQKMLVRDIDGKTYETYCRKASPSMVHQLVAVPKLVKCCADALVRLSRENLLLSLFDYSQIENMRPLSLRTRCLSITEDASYRIQYDSSGNALYFSFLPPEESLLTEPRPKSEIAMVEGCNEKMEIEGADATNKSEAPEIHKAEGNGVQGELPTAKRIKLK